MKAQFNVNGARIKLAFSLMNKCALINFAADVFISLRTPNLEKSLNAINTIFAKIAVLNSF